MAAEVRVIHDAAAGVLEVWLQDPAAEPVVETAADGVVIVRTAGGRVVGVRITGYRPAGAAGGVTVSTTVHSQTVTTKTHRQG
jgi:hypothetical protein